MELILGLFMELQNLHFKKAKPFHGLHQVYVQHLLPQLLPARLKKPNN